MTDLNPLTTEKFRRWLYTKSPEQGVGHIYSRCFCPIATYLQEEHGYMHPEVGRDYVRARHGSIRWRLPTPVWVDEFIDAIHWLPRDLGAPITAREALVYLRDIEERLTWMRYWSNSLKMVNRSNELLRSVW